MQLIDLLNFVGENIPLFTLLLVAFSAGKLFNKFDYLEKRVGSFGQKLERVEKTTENIATYLGTKFGVDKGLFSSMSPLQLTKKGLALAQKSGFDDLYAKHKNYFLKKLSAKNPKSDADLEEAALSLLFNLDNLELIDQLKTAAFENGIDLLLLQRTLAIFLREKVKKELFSK